jgi:tetratricopeptide (TPR) repeat protein
LVGLFGLGSKDPTKKSISKKKKELRKLVKAKKYDSALRIGSEILQKNPDENDVLFILGGIYYMKTKYKTAISYFEKSLEIATHDVEVLILTANSNFRLGNFKQAIICCETIKEIDPKNKAVEDLLEKIKSAKNN